MRRTRWQRALTGAIGLWLTTTVSGLTLPVCPEHGGGMLGLTPGAPAGAHHGATSREPVQGAAWHHDHDARPAGPMGDGRAAPSPDHGRHSGHQCSCPGTCCVTAAVTVPSGRLLAIPVVPIEVAVVAPPVERQVTPHAAPDVALPPPLGPPALRA